MEKFLYIAAGAVLGAFCRHGLGLFVAERGGQGFPYGTLLINVLGSFVLGWFLTQHLQQGKFDVNVHYFLAVGWCASFTTFSTFSWETFGLIQDGRLGAAVLNAGLSLFLCLLATWGGVLSARAMNG